MIRNLRVDATKVLPIKEEHLVTHESRGTLFGLIHHTTLMLIQTPPYHIIRHMIFN